MKFNGLPRKFWSVDSVMSIHWRDCLSIIELLGCSVNRLHVNWLLMSHICPSHTVLPTSEIRALWLTSAVHSGNEHISYERVRTVNNA